MAKPNFIHIGPGRTGSTYIYSILKQHPKIALPKVKEINFFNSNYSKGHEWYEKHFVEDDNLISGDFSNLYFYEKLCSERIAKDYPDIKVFCVLRNPFDRTISNFQYQKRSGSIETGISFTDALIKYPDLGQQNHFTELTKHHQESLGRNFKIFFFDDLENSPTLFFQELSDFLGIDYKLLPKDLKGHKNQSRNLRHPFLAKTNRKIADALRKIGLVKLLDSIKNSKLIWNLIYSNDVIEPKIEFPYDLTFKINQDIQNLEILLKKDLKNWKR